MSKSGTKFFRIYVYVSLFLIVFLLASLVGAIAYGGKKVRQESSTFNSKVNTFNQSVNTINKNLETMNSQLAKENERTNSLPSGL